MDSDTIKTGRVRDNTKTADKVEYNEAQIEREPELPLIPAQEEPYND